MKNALICIAMLVSSLCFAQKQLGLSAVYGSDIGTLGAGLRGVIIIDEHFSFVPEIVAFLPKNQNINIGENQTVKAKSNMILFNADMHYTFDWYIKNTELYALAGFNYTETNRDVEVPDPEDIEFEKFKDSGAGANLGFGGRYAITTNLYLFAEAKYIFNNNNQSVFNFGILTNF